MADRLASEKDVLNYLKGGADIAVNSEQETALLLILEGVSASIEEEVLAVPGASMAQQDYSENYGVEHYGHHDRRVIRLLHWPVVVVTSVIDNSSLTDPQSYSLSPNTGVLRLLYGRFSNIPYGVQVNYTAGYSSTGADTPWPSTTRIAVPKALQSACIKQVVYEYSQREPGGSALGATAVSRTDSSLIYLAQDFLPEVRRAIERFRLR